MTIQDIIVTNYEKALTNADYITEVLDELIRFDELPNVDCSITIRIKDVSMSLASGYGTWRVSVKLCINDVEKTYSLTHHNEDWFLSQKIVYEHDRYADSETDYDNALQSFQGAFELVIDYYIDDIISVIESICEDYEKVN